ncbi:MAG: GtrA family protein [Pseudomonadales bacterium]|nr:GtrA family protein [Pseudomonadales bacterium]
MSQASHGKTLPRFIVVGGIGFLTDAGVLSLLTLNLEKDIYLSRVVSFLCASAITWFLNRVITFKTHTNDQHDIKSKEYVRYMVVQTVGVSINFIVFYGCIWLAPSFEKLPIVPLAIASGIAMFFNYFGARRWVYRAAQH